MNRILLAVAVLLFLGRTAAAQNLTTGAVQGVVSDKSTGDPLPGVTVVASSPALQGEQATITDEAGLYKITSLPAGTYELTFLYAELTVKRKGIDVSINKTTPAYVALDTTQAVGEVITIVARAPAIDPTSTTQGVTLDQDFVRNLPVGRSYEDLLGAAAGSTSDDAGVSFSGSSSLENQYIVDGLNTTTLVYGQVGSPIVNEFIQETEIITGGYNAEYGRSTGGVVNVVTKTGSNQLHGSLFGYASPGAFAAAAEPIPTQTSSIDAESELIVDADFGFEMGGPVVKDRLWFYAGVAPQVSREYLDRVTKRRVDADGDGTPDVDPETGFLVFEELDRERRRLRTTSYPFVGKLNFAVAPEHQGMVSVIGTPVTGNDLGIMGLPEATHLEYTAVTTDAAGKWTSKLDDNKMELEAVVGYHRSSYAQAPRFGEAANRVRQNLYYGDLATWGQLGGESAETIAGCTDGGPDDPYPLIRNCPDEGNGYAIGGPGALSDSEEERYSGRLSATRRVALIGHHELKAGVDIEDNRLRTRRQTSGDMYFDVMLPTDWSAGETYLYQFVRLGDGLGDTCSDTDGGTDHSCELLGPTDVHGQTMNWATYLRDSWQIKPNLTLNLGVRYEEQRLRHERDVRNTTDPLTGAYRGTNAMTLRDMWAPRLGVVYDWTKEGRSKVYASWGRFYESVPLALNAINFGGETTYRTTFQMDQCGESVQGVGGPDGQACVDSGDSAMLGSTVYGGGSLVAPGIKPQYLDEAVLGVEYEMWRDFKVGIAYHDRRLGRVLEDVSPDYTQTYVIANPGEFPEEEEAALRRQIEECTDPDECAHLEYLLGVFTGIRDFDKPTRVYNAIQLTATKRFADRWFLQGSYTYARLRGNFPGLYSPDSGAILPNITAQYDLYELLGNREGPLPNDRPHDLKIDAYYSVAGATVGARGRIASGTPVDALGSSAVYGFDESFVLPRGAIGRTPIDAGLDMHFGYARDLGRGMTVEVFTDLFNVVNRQGATYLDETYTQDPINPIIGGDGEDVLWAKGLDWDGTEPVEPVPVARNRNFRNAEVRNPPFMARLGARLTF